ncbi:MAG: helix-turn-helix domain-containing protein [Nitrospiraceae bacterium]|nr:helix-turn-helix domain-containing protein [Nitrospiraceae bacterium]
MKTPAPVFKDREQTYEADTCTALRRAAEQGRVTFNAFARGHYPGARLPRTWLPGLKSVGYWNAPGPQDWGLDWHRNEGIEFTFLSTGRTPFAVDDQSCPLRAGNLAITRPWQRHRVGNPHVGAGRLHWVILDVGVRHPNQAWRWPAWLVLAKPDRERLTQLLRHNEQPVWHTTPEVRHCFDQLSQAIDKSDGAGRQSRLTVHLNELFLAVLEMFTQRDIALDPGLSSSRRTVELFLDDLSADLDGLALPWTARAMAEHCGLGVTAFTQYCRQVTNRTPVRYLNHCRVQTAARLLTGAPDMTITDIALACGFRTSQYFATAFRQHQGCTPRAYRGGAR